MRTLMTDKHSIQKCSKERMKFMKTKECPYCHEEISEDAILCKYCHNLLTEDDDEEPVMVYDPEPEDDERTRVFSASEAVKNVKGFNDDYDDEDYDEYDDDDEDYDDDDDDDYDDDYAKRTFITAAVVTLGILLIVIIAIVAGYKIFGGDDDSSAPSLNTSMVDSSASGQPAKPADASIDETSKGDDESSETDDSSVTDESSQDETSSAPDETSSAEESSSQEETSSADESSEDESSSAAEAPEDVDAVIAKASELISSHNDSGVKSYEFRAADSAGITMDFYYIHMNNGTDYSVAYNPSTGKYIIVGGGERFEG